MQITSNITQEYATTILEQLKSNAITAGFIGDAASSNTILDDLLAIDDLTIERLSDYQVFTRPIHSAYFGEENTLNIEILIPYDTSYDKFIYAIALYSATELISVLKIGKFKKSQGIGGSIIIKTTISNSNETSLVFRNDIFLSEEEYTKRSANFESNMTTKIESKLNAHNTTIRNLIDDFTIKATKEVEKAKTQVENAKLQAIRAEAAALEIRTEHIYRDLEDYLDKEVNLLSAKLQDFANIGKHDYFLSTTLPRDYLPMGAYISAFDSPYLWYRLRATTLHRGLYFYTPHRGLYAKSTTNLDLIGAYSEQQLPDLVATDVSKTVRGYRFTHAAGSGGNIGLSGADYGFKASYYNPLYSGDNVEVSSNLYLEGIYQGKYKRRINGNNR